MGSSSSKENEQKNLQGGREFVQDIRSRVEDEIAKRKMLQREAQMAINVAKARDNIAIFGSAWAALTVGASVAQLAGRKPPSTVGVSIAMGALLLGNMYDMAYGNKLMRVTKEAEYLLTQERGRFVPMKQESFFKFYTETDREAYYNGSTAVGDLYPSRIWARMSLPWPEK